MSTVPESFVRDIATKHRVTKTELDTLLLALQDRSGAEIAKTLEISEAAVRKRLGESYKKFHVAASGNKKLSYLKQKLLTEYESRQPQTANLRQDWGEAVDVEDFCGRDNQLTELETWILGDAAESGRTPNRCRLVAILGLGGIGKTALAAQIAKRVQGEFDYLIWRSVRNGPTLNEILAELLKFLPTGHDTDLPDDENSRLLRLLQVLRDHRCLIILDNVESILKPHERAGDYAEGYESYGYLFKKIGEAAHQSCLLLTSREKPKEVAALEGKNLPVKVLQLEGLRQDEAWAILKDKGFSGSQAELNELVERYSGNPLALKIVATTIHDLFNNNVAEFLSQINQETAVYGDIRTLLDQQFDRLSKLEKQVMYWLAINRDYVSLNELKADIPTRESPMRLLEAVESLSRRSLIIKEPELGKLSQLPVIMEYVTEQIVEQVYREIQQLIEHAYNDTIDWQTIQFLNCYSLVKAGALDYIRKAEEHQILEPIKTKLLNTFETNLEAYIRRVFSHLRKQSAKKGYAAGNLINLLRQLQIDQPKIDLSGRNFAGLSLWRAYLKDVNLQGTLFTNADLTGSVFTETMASLVSVRFSPDGRFFATGVGDGEIRLWQASDTKQVQIYRGHTAWVWAIAFSPDSRLLASGSADYTIKLWDVQTGACLKTLEQHRNKVYSVAFSPDGKTLASASEDCTVKLWDVASGTCLETLEDHTDWVWAVTFSPVDQRVLATGSADGTAKLWHIARSEDPQGDAGECVKTLHGHTNQVYSVAFNATGQTLASSGEDQTIRLWDTFTGQCLNVLKGHSKKIYSVRFSPTRIASLEGGAQILASSGEDRTVKLWNSDTGECLRTLKGHISQVWSIAFSPDGRTLLSSSDDQTARLWDVETGHLLNVLQGYTRAVYSVQFNPDAQTLASGSDDHTVRLWDVRSGECLGTLQGHRGRIRSVTFLPAGDMLASGSGDSTIKLWRIRDRATGELVRTLEGHSNWVWTVVSSPDGKLLASSSEDRTLRLWDVKTGNCLKVLEGHTHWVWTVAFSPDGQLLASGSADSKVKLWDVRSGRCLNTLDNHKDLVWSVAFSPDGLLLASGSEDQTIKLWDVQTGKCLQTLVGHQQQVYAVAFSPDGKTLASGSGDQTVKLWDVQTNRCIETLEGRHNAAIRTVAFSANGQMLASGSEDETVQLWDVQKGSRIRQLKSDRIYEGMDIAGVSGLTDAQLASLKTLGAVENDGTSHKA